MSYTIGRILWFLLTPSKLLLVLGIIGTLMALITARRRWSSFALFIWFMLGIASLSPVSSWVIGPLENRFPDWRQNNSSAGPVEGVAGIIMLGGSVDTLTSSARVFPLELNEAGDRVLEMIALANRFPTARIVVTGGVSDIVNANVPEAEQIRRKISAFGLSPERLIFEGRSRNTVENALFTRDLVQPKPGERWLLVTSAFHMPRSVGVFRKAGFKVEPYPVDFRTNGNDDLSLPSASLGPGLARLDTGIKEWIGLLAYRLQGHTDAFFPAP